MQTVHICDLIDGTSYENIVNTYEKIVKTYEKIVKTYEKIVKTYEKIVKNLWKNRQKPLKKSSSTGYPY